MDYRENPKMAGSGMLAAIPQGPDSLPCPRRCKDCFFQSGRSYLEPLADHLPNMPSVDDARFRVVRVNDGLDSHVGREAVMAVAQQYPLRFYNTSFADDIAGYDAPVVLTINPGTMTDLGWSQVAPIPPNLMFVRFRTNTWNLAVCDDAVAYYARHEIPIVLTFMAYFDTADEAIPEEHRALYQFRQRTTNSYWAITTAAWESVMARYAYNFNLWVHSCGKIEGERGTTKCRHCGNCLREFFATRERMAAATKEP